MTTDQFSKQEFEYALENISFHHNLDFANMKVQKLYEYIYRIPMQNNGLLVVVHSSVSVSSGIADGTGENSIRVWIQNPLTLKPVMQKSQKWITRVSGWEQRLKAIIAQQTDLASHLQFCDACQSYETLFEVFKGKPENRGRLFKKCECNGSFTWVTDTNGDLLDNIPY